MMTTLPIQLPERQVNWDQHLSDYLVRFCDNYTEPDWGKKDCIYYTLGAVQAVTGFDIIGELNIPEYSTEEEAWEVLKQFGDGTLTSAWDNVLGTRDIPANSLAGDIGLHGTACGIVMGKRALFLGSNGVGWFPVMKMDAVYRIGR